MSNQTTELKPRYTSMGTVRLEINLTKPDSPKYEVFFTPDTKFSVEYKGKCYAVFFSCVNDCDGKLIECYTKDSDTKNVRSGIKFPTDADLVSILSSGAAHQVKVKIKVDKSLKKLVSVTLPAPAE